MTTPDIAARLAASARDAAAAMARLAEAADLALDAQNLTDRAAALWGWVNPDGDVVEAQVGDSLDDLNGDDVPLWTDPAQVGQFRSVALVAAERARQVADEGYDAAHDLTHGRHVLAAAASCYLAAATSIHPHELPCPSYWPWDPIHWKPSPDHARNLVKAAALICAELDLLLALDGPE